MHVPPTTGFSERLARTLGACLFLLTLAPFSAQAGTRNLTVRFMAPPEPDVAGYKLYLAFASMSYGAGTDIGLVLPGTNGIAQYTVSGLDDSLDYYVALSAYDAAGNESGLSDEILVAALPAPGVECVADMDCADDGNVCNGAPVCSPTGACLPGRPLACAMGDSCNVAMCDPVSGCATAPRPDGTTCNDGNAQTQSDACRMGVCVGEVIPAPTEIPDPAGECQNAFGAPDGARLSWTGEPSTTMTVVWDAPFHPNGAFLRYRRAWTTQPWILVEGSLLSFQGCDARYVVELSGLTANGAYYYQVSGAGKESTSWSTQEMFRLPRSAGQNFGWNSAVPGTWNFAFFASSGLANVPGSQAAAYVMRAIRARNPAVVLGGGGYAYAEQAMAAGAVASPMEAVDRWLDQVSVPAARAPFLPVFGETDVEGYGHGEQRAFYQDAHPVLRPAGAPSGTYSFDVGPTHFVAINAPTLDALDVASTEGAAQIAWIDADIAAARRAGQRWIIAYMHADLHSSEAGVAPRVAIQQMLDELFTRHAVNLVLSGDGTSFERTFPMTPTSAGLTFRTNGPFSERDGPIFVRAGTGGRTDFAAFASTTRPAWSAARNNDRSTYVSVTVGGRTRLVVTTFGIRPGTSVPRVLDQFVIQ